MQFRKSPNTPSDPLQRIIIINIKKKFPPKTTAHIRTLRYSSMRTKYSLYL
jgi:hypothetical protein